jgi:hypothetical protein
MARPGPGKGDSLAAYPQPGVVPLDWLDTEESQRLLNYQKHTFEDFLRDRKASMGLKRYYIRLTRPIHRRKWLKQSPFYKANMQAKK